MYRSLNVVLRCHGRIIRAGASMLVLLCYVRHARAR